MTARRAPRPVALLTVALLALVAGFLVAGGSAHSAAPSESPGSIGASAPERPPADADWDYQLGGAVAPEDNVGTVVRDRREDPLEGVCSVCHVNGFQTQPDEKRFWRQRWDLVLKKGGDPVVDGAWCEWLLDIRTDRKRQRLADIVGRWTARCAADGFDAVELDNLDSFSRCRGLVSTADTRAFARLLLARAHDAGLAVAQKNWVELGARGPRIGFDFAVVEECGRWRECQGYVDAYGPAVLMVEYRAGDFTWTCERFADHPVVRRDRALSADGVRAWC